MAKGIYGHDIEKNLLGVYRADEDNRVAAGKQFMKLRAVPHKGPEFISALASLDAPKLHLELRGSILADVLQKAENFLGEAQLSLEGLNLYLDTFLTVQASYVHEALKHFPMERVMKRFAKIWARNNFV